MKNLRTILFSVTSGLALLPVICAAIADDNPYKTIVERNPFALIPPPPPAPATPETPPSNVKLTGITTMFGETNALLMVQESGPGKLPQYLTLTKGQREGSVEVLEIHDDTGIVKIKNSGNAEVLSFEKNGITLAPAPMSAPPTGISPLPGSPNPTGQPGVNPGAGSFNTINPGRNPGGMVQPQSTSGLRQIPTRQMRSQSQAAPANGAANVIADAAVIEINREAHKNDPNYPPMPPTPFSQEATSP